MAHHIDRVLVGYASSGGSTRAVAEFIAARLRVHSVLVDAVNLDERPAVDGYDAVVIGSAIHGRALLPAAESFVLRHADALRVRPVWLFSLGMGPSLRGPIGRLLRNAVPPRIAELCELVGPRDYRAFAGVMPRGDSPLLARFLLWLCGGRYGDFRDWPAIDRWTADIASYLHVAVPAEEHSR